MVRFVAIVGSNDDDLVRRAIGNMLKDSTGIVRRDSLDRKLRRELGLTGSPILDVSEEIKPNSHYGDIAPLEKKYSSIIYVVDGEYINLRDKVVGRQRNPQHPNRIESDFDFSHLEIPQTGNSSNALKLIYIH